MEMAKYFSSNLELVQNEMELQEEIICLKKALAMKKSNDKLAALLTRLEDIKATCQYIVDHKIELRKRLQCPKVPNALPIKFDQQEKFVTCCQKLPEVIKFLESVSNERKVNMYHFLNSRQIVSHMEQEIKFEKEYTSQIKYFLSTIEGFLKNINAAVALVHGNEGQKKIDNSVYNY
ncbi:uncharacterized protein [Hetaerina americana]|uniref:uncharacterized protein n=1 Tax=Hetaerina americana TaxID=62018 RepID=UPI003A7F4071